MARLNLARIKSEVAAKLHDDSITDAQVERWVDMAHDRIFRVMECDFLLDVKSFDTASTQRVYYIESAFNRILHVLNEDTDEVLSEISEKAIRNIDPSFSDTGTPEAYSLFGYAEVQAQFTEASQISVVSSSASDTVPTVRIRGVISGVETTQALTLNGTTKVTSTGTYDANQDILVRLSAPCVGNITVNSEGTLLSDVTLVVVPIGFLRRPYNKIALYPIPSAAETLRALVYRNPFYLTDEEDIPDLPQGWEDLVLRGVLIEAHRYAYEFDVADKLDMYLEKEILKLSGEQGNTRNSSRRLKGISKYEFPVRGRMPKTFTGN